MRLTTSLRSAFWDPNVGSHRRRRAVAIFQGFVSALAHRGLGVAIGLISVPLTIGYLGAERYGVWALVGSTLAWLRLADVGIGFGLNNAIAGAFGMDRHDLVRQHVSTGLALLGAIALAVGAIVALAWPWIDWNALFNVKTELAKAEVGPAMAVAIGIFLIGFPISIIAKVFIATQDGKLQNYWAAAASVSTLIGLLVVTHTQGGLVWLVIAISGTSLFVDAMSGVWLFVRHKPHFAPRIASIKRESVAVVMNVGMQFFLIQIMALVVFETGNFVVAHYLGADQVPAYNLTYKLFGYTSLVQSILFGYLWVAYSEAIARGDVEWVRKTFRQNQWMSMGLAAAMVVVLIFIARPFIRVWAGDVAVPSQELVYWMAAWSLINAYCSPAACLFAAAGHLKAQLMYSALATAAIVVLSITLVKTWGAVGVIAAPVLAYLVFICVPIAIDASHLMKKLRDTPQPA